MVVSSFFSIRFLLPVLPDCCPDLKNDVVKRNGHKLHEIKNAHIYRRSVGEVMKFFKKESGSGLHAYTVISFVVVLALCSLLTAITIANRMQVEKLRVDQLILERSWRISEVVTKLLYKTESLSAIVIQEEGKIEDLEIIAPAIMDDDAILNFLIAPGGVVSNVFPLQGNESVIGLDFFNDESAGNIEAIAARDSGTLVMGGPFMTLQGVPAIVGRKPVYLTQSGERVLWGLVSITLKFPQALDGADLSFLEANGLDYELWRIDPDTDQRQTIVSSDKAAGSNARYVERQVSILNAEWYLRISPVRAWYSYAENILLIVTGLLISFLTPAVVQNSCKLRTLAATDSLTGLYNRRYFMEASKTLMERSRRLSVDDFIIVFDIDKFKSINDKYGHLIGDKVLIEVSSRVKAALRPYDLIARYGGEEFIILASGIAPKDAYDLAERLRLIICTKEFRHREVHFTVSASFGLARVDDWDDLDNAINNADNAMYAAKEGGRNKVVLQNC